MIYQQPQLNPRGRFRDRWGDETQVRAALVGCPRNARVRVSSAQI